MKIFPRTVLFGVLNYILNIYTWFKVWHFSILELDSVAQISLKFYRWTIHSLFHDYFLPNSAPGLLIYLPKIFTRFEVYHLLNIFFEFFKFKINSCWSYHVVFLSPLVLNSFTKARNRLNIIDIKYIQHKFIQVYEYSLILLII